MRKGAIIRKLNELLETVQLKLPSDCSQTRKRLENLPSWFRELGVDDGITALEGRIGHTIPEPLQLFYQFPATACWLLASEDTDIFLDNGRNAVIQVLVVDVKRFRLLSPVYRAGVFVPPGLHCLKKEKHPLTAWDAVPMMPVRSGVSI